MEILSDFLVNLIRLPDRLGQFELLTFGRCDMEHIPCGRWLQLQQRLIDRLRLTGYLQAAAKTSEHLFFSSLPLAYRSSRFFRRLSALLVSNDTFGTRPSSANS